MTVDRRQFVTALIASGAAAALLPPAVENSSTAQQPRTAAAAVGGAEVDFRYAPHHSQSTLCFPDDPLKTIVGQNGDLRYGFAISPLYCWREEQPLQNALVGQDWGDMPHNWASAECVRYLRHMLILEDGESLRLLNGVTGAEFMTSSLTFCGILQHVSEGSTFNLNLREREAGESGSIGLTALPVLEMAPQHSAIHLD